MNFLINLILYPTWADFLVEWKRHYSSIRSTKIKRAKTTDAPDSSIG